MEKSMNYKQKALDHVRSVCPELMELSFGCWVYSEWRNSRVRHFVLHADYDRRWGRANDKYVWIAEARWGKKPNGGSTKKVLADDVTIIGHTPHLDHWLRGVGIDETTDVYVNSELETLSVVKQSTPLNLVAQYNLTKDGENQSEEFYKAYCEIVGV